MLSSTVQEEIMPQESLLNDQFRPPPSSDRVLMNVHPDTRERLRDLLATAPELQGVGYSAFINRAIEVAIEQIDRRRRLAQVRFSNYNADLEVDLRRGEDGLSDLGLGD
jgi:hypothetical protein